MWGLKCNFSWKYTLKCTIFSPLCLTYNAILWPIFHFRYKSPSPGLAPPLPPHQPRSAVHHPFLQGPNFPTGNVPGGGTGNGCRPGENGVLDAVKKRVQSPRRRDFKDFSAPRDFRSPNRFNGNHDSGFLLPGYALSPDEDEDSGADSLNEQISKFNGRQTCFCSHFTRLKKST